MKNRELLKRDSKTLFKEPNSTFDWYGQDQPGKYKLGGVGTDPLTKHLSQTNTFGDIIYKMNSLGLRGPEPDYNNDNRILCAGGSFVFGTGVNNEDTFIDRLSSTLNASYINLSDADSITELLEPINEYAEKFKPTCIILGDTRFLDEYGWTWRHLYTTFKDTFKEGHKEYTKLMRKKLVDRNRKVMELILFYLKNNFDVPIFFITANRKDFKFYNILKDMGTHIIRVKALDLARDNRHPGVKSHNYIKQEILKWI